MHHVALDASVLINFLIIERCDLLGALPRHQFHVLGRVQAEVTRSRQREVLSEALTAELVKTAPPPRPTELLLARRHEQVMGRGEAACLAAAECRDWLFACDELRRVRRIAVERIGDGRIVTTAGILVRAVRARIITIPEADEIKSVLEKNRFRMDFESFADCLP